MQLVKGGKARGTSWGQPLASCCRWLFSSARFPRLVLDRVCFCDSFTNNFQRQMSRLKQRWRAQRSVISIVNCRIPRTNRTLNVHCAVGLFLAACLLQCLYSFHAWYSVSFVKRFWASASLSLLSVVEYSELLALLVHHVDEKLMVFKWFLLDSDAIEAFRRGDHWSWDLFLIDLYPWHEVRSANPLNLSI